MGRIIGHPGAEPEMIRFPHGTEKSSTTYQQNQAGFGRFEAEIKRKSNGKQAIQIIDLKIDKAVMVNPNRHSHIVLHQKNRPS